MNGFSMANLSLPDRILFFRNANLLPAIMGDEGQEIIKILQTGSHPPWMLRVL